ncbi:MAG: sulfurtransferase TusA family protein [Mariprofundaceae bacterium]|nr:sulfurtransferase TusA family protein [Mariprofundaceae bacterium]
MKYFLDITRETFPMTFVKAKLRLARMDAGEKLEVLLNEGESLENVPRSCEGRALRCCPTNRPMTENICC